MILEIRIMRVRCLSTLNDIVYVSHLTFILVFLKKILKKANTNKNLSRYFSVKFVFKFQTIIGSYFTYKIPHSFHNDVNINYPFIFLFNIVTSN